MLDNIIYSETDNYPQISGINKGSKQLCVYPG